MKDKKSCHSKYKSDSVIVPILYGIQNNIFDNIATLTSKYNSNNNSFFKCESIGRDLLMSYFRESCAVSLDDDTVGICDLCRNSGQACNINNDYANDIGALKGLSEDLCDVAFIKENSWDKYCNNGSSDDIPDWCGKSTDYRQILLLLDDNMGAIPSRSFMIRPYSHSNSYNIAISNTILTEVHRLLVNLNNEASILNDLDLIGISPLIYNVSDNFLTDQATINHVDSFSQQLTDIPGINTYINTNDYDPSTCLDSSTCFDDMDDYTTNCENAPQLGSTSNNPIKFGLPNGITTNEIELFETFFNEILTTTGLYITGVTKTSIKDLYQHNVDIIIADAGLALLGSLRYNFQLLALEQNKAIPYYTHNSTVLISTASNANVFNDLQNHRICLGSLFDASGSLLPISWALKDSKHSNLNNYLNTTANTIPIDQCDSPLKDLYSNFFNQICSPPSHEGGVGFCDLCPSTTCDYTNNYYSAKGALRGISEGSCNVAFVRSNTYDKYCNNDNKKSWCIDSKYFKTLKQFDINSNHYLAHNFGTIPTDGFLIRSKMLSTNDLLSLQAVLLSINHNDDLLKILAFDAICNNTDTTEDTFFGTADELDQILTNNTQAHLATFKTDIKDIPGYDIYQDCYELDTDNCKTNIDSNCINIDSNNLNDNKASYHKNGAINTLIFIIITLLLIVIHS